MMLEVADRVENFLRRLVQGRSLLATDHAEAARLSGEVHVARTSLKRGLAQ